MQRGLIHELALPKKAWFKRRCSAFWQQGSRMCNFIMHSEDIHGLDSGP